jgi:hypothetical protein
MKRLDEGKVSLVEFLNSIRFNQQDTDQREECARHFAQINPRVRGGQPLNGEESQLIRSAN